ICLCGGSVTISHISPLQSEQRAGVSNENPFLNVVFEPQLLEPDEGFLQIDVRKISSKKRLLLEPAANRSDKLFGQLFRQIARSVYMHILLVRYDADQLLRPGPSRMGGDDFHLGKL